MRIIDDMTVPARHARACVVDKGQILRIHQVEGEQVGDCAFFNADNVKEQFHVGQSWALNVMLGTGTAKAFTHFYSNPPHENVMLTVVDDTVRTHFGNCAGRCSTKLLQMRNGVQGGRSCQENLAEALAPYGLLGEDIHDVFNVFMNVDLFVDGGFRVKPPLARKGDYIDLKAEMTILAAVSACPNTSNPVNNYSAKPLGLTVYEPTT